VTVALAVLAFGAPLASGSPLALHPKDGPDADLRFVLGEQTLRAVIVLNLAFVDGVIDVPRQKDGEVLAHEQDGLREALVAYLAEQNSVSMDDVEVQARLVEFEIEPADLSLLPLFPNDGARALTRVRLVFDYPVIGEPQRMGLTWGAYPLEAPWEAPAPTSEGAQPMDVTARLAVPGDEVLITFTEDEPGFLWHRNAELEERFNALPDMPVPRRPSVHLLSSALLLLVAGLALCGGNRVRRSLSWSLPAALLGAWATWSVAVVPLPFGDDDLPTASQARALFEPLHANIYRAFDFTTESDIYDALARTVDGQLLASLYDQVYRGLIMAEHGGAVSRVSAVRLTETNVRSIGNTPPSGRPGFTIEARWQVDGVVHHWGHSHSRVNEYRALYTVASTDDGWRIVGSQILEQRRVSGSPLPAAQEAPDMGPVPDFEAMTPNAGSDS